jgi:anti-sigma factor RsiW
MKSQQRKHYGEKDLLLLYYDELSHEERSDVERHLADCGECREIWQTLQQALDAVPRVSLNMSGEEARRFAQRVAGQVVRRRLSRVWMWGGGLVAAALLALTLTVRPPGLLPGAGDNPKTLADAGIVKDMDLLQNMDLLEQLDFLQDLDGQG